MPSVPSFKYVALDPDGFEVEIELPGKYVVCDRCDGTGKHDHPAFSNGITASEWNDEWDEDSRREYLRGGYNVRCEVCQGARVVLAPDESRCDPIEYAEWRRRADEEAQQRAMEAAERRMESRMLGEY